MHSVATPNAAVETASAVEDDVRVVQYPASGAVTSWQISLAAKKIPAAICCLPLATPMGGGAERRSGRIGIIMDSCNISLNKAKATTATVKRRRVVSDNSSCNDDDDDDFGGEEEEEENGVVRAPFPPPPRIRRIETAVGCK